MDKITIDGKEYDLTNVSENVQKKIDNLLFVNRQIVQRNNELQIAETAKIGYSRALTRELQKV